MFFIRICLKKITIYVTHFFKHFVKFLNDMAILGSRDSNFCQKHHSVNRNDLHPFNITKTKEKETESTFKITNPPVL